MSELAPMLASRLLVERIIAVCGVVAMLVLL